TRAILNSGLVELAGSAVTVLVSVVMMAFIDPVLFGLAVVVVALVFVAVFLIGKRTRPSGLRLQTALGELSDSLSRGLGAIRTIRATRAGRREADATVAKAARALHEGLTVARLRAVIQTFTGVAVQVLLIAVVGVGALRVAAGAMTVGELSAFLMYLLLMAAPISLFGAIVSLLGEAFGALSRISELRALRPERDVERPGAGGAATRDDGVLFRFEDVWFTYAHESGGQALKGVSLDIRAGVTTAVVGPSGAGKTTLFSLLERFYEPTGGRLLYRGRDVAGLSRDDLRSRIAYVEQDAPALSGTVLDNLVLAAPSATEDECAAALVEVNLVPDVDSGRRYLRQPVGEVGSRLSGGERQRLAIARALIARSPVLLLDEVTSNLDGRNERLVQELVGSAGGERTVVVIAHRLSTVAAADDIVVLDAGRVVARGTHPELLERSPLYRELAQHQLLHDRADEVVAPR
ncbi:ABC transporter ATP-binding protein, partial [Actinosynnema sp. NPDC059797]